MTKATYSSEWCHSAAGYSVTTGFYPCVIPVPAAHRSILLFGFVFCSKVLPPAENNTSESV